MERLFLKKKEERRGKGNVMEKMGDKTRGVGQCLSKKKRERLGMEEKIGD